MARESGEPYITHPIAVAQLLTELRMDPEAIAAGLLHDVAEDTDYGVDYIRTHFGATIAKLVDGVTKLKKIQEKKGKSDEPVSNQKAESLRKMMLASIEDLRVLIIKLADRLHNMRTLAGRRSTNGAALPVKRSTITRPSPTGWASGGSSRNWRI